MVTGMKVQVHSYSTLQFAVVVYSGLVLVLYQLLLILFICCCLRVLWKARAVLFYVCRYNDPEVLHTVVKQGNVIFAKKFWKNLQTETIWTRLRQKNKS